MKRKRVSPLLIGIVSGLFVVGHYENSLACIAPTVPLKLGSAESSLQQTKMSMTPWGFDIGQTHYSVNRSNGTAKWCGVDPIEETPIFQIRQFAGSTAQERLDLLKTLALVTETASPEKLPEIRAGEKRFSLATMVNKVSKDEFKTQLENLMVAQFTESQAPNTVKFERETLSVCFSQRAVHPVIVTMADGKPHVVAVVVLDAPDGSEAGVLSARVWGTDSKIVGEGADLSSPKSIESLANKSQPFVDFISRRTGEGFGQTIELSADARSGLQKPPLGRLTLSHMLGSRGIGSNNLEAFDLGQTRKSIGDCKGIRTETTAPGNRANGQNQ